ncbi:hypothetical protein F0562_003923 [Nyssa sinensis]|uniref:Uncharacterized protein n=1 Tax=Nyssa sinensis TaxID=561372 RepID=A0A5J5BXX1_9ASTE|nr:hypothetical protein F0562_003923 [Nyssa sinensis]
MTLSRPFVDFCIWGWDNLTRTVLMYCANFISSPEGYFHIIICNAQEFRNTTVNNDLHFISWDNPPKQHPHYLTIDDMSMMVDSNAPFARKFHQNGPVLEKIYSELLLRGQGMLVPGGWCKGSRKNGTDPCSVVGNITVLRPTAEGLSAAVIEWCWVCNRQQRSDMAAVIAWWRAYEMDGGHDEEQLVLLLLVNQQR